MNRHDIYIVLENIRSAENVGSIFRTADALGVSKIFLVGITPNPIDRFGRTQSKVAKAALGAEKTMPFEHVDNTQQLIQKLQKENVQTVAIEQHTTAIDYKAFELQGPTAFIFGAEVEGVSKEALTTVDKICEIPMHGKKESLNVAVSVGVALYRILDR